jgi:hypothetical protein
MNRTRGIHTDPKVWRLLIQVMPFGEEKNKGWKDLFG